MNPIYKFELTAGEDTHLANPIYSAELSKDFEKESEQEFFREKLSGKLTFMRDDYQFIVGKSFDTQFVLDIYISYNRGVSWSEYWHGTFWKTDCEFNADDMTVEVKPEVLDNYNAILAGMEKEYNLIELTPDISPVKADKRPMIQVYVPGQTVIGCFLAGMWWEQECEAVTDVMRLQSTFHFSFNRSYVTIDVYGDQTPYVPRKFEKVVNTKFLTNQGTEVFTADEFTLEFYFGSSGLGYVQRWRMYQNSNLLWEYLSDPGTYIINEQLPHAWELLPVEDSGAIGNVGIRVSELAVYARYVCDVNEIGDVQTYDIPADDFVSDNRNYHKIIGYYFPNTITFNDSYSETPTQWGLYQPGKYYDHPYFLGIDFYPVARSAWRKLSIWFSFYVFDWVIEAKARKSFVIRDAYPLSSVIAVLLNQIAPDITHEASTSYSQFLYGTNIANVTQTLLITPKSNIITSGYDQPAQQAPITLKYVLDMLRDCFRCYWWIDSDKKLRIEHIQYFRNGGSYSGTPVVGIDLTTEKVPRNGKALSFATSKYKYEKPDMSARYQFGWMDQVTQLFEGYPIDILSKYVSQDNIAQINVSQFTSDIDYILLNPEAVSKDGFVLLAATLDEDDELVLPYYNYVIGVNDHYLQNAYVAFCLLQRYYAYDMPARYYQINGVDYTAIGIKRLKTQSINFPLLNDPNLFELVKTNIGNGMIQKISINLSGRNAKATLMYDTQ